MCGIVGYLGDRLAAEVIIDGLKSLEYRGYDSAGIAVIEDDKLKVTRSKGKIVDLKQKMGEDYKFAHIGIGHTRWATHGKPSDENSHPHRDCTGKFAVVHNGIIENFLELRKSLIAEGHRFSSDTDTEVVAHLVEKYYQGDLLQAVTQATKDLRGAYAIVVISEADPDILVAARKDNPLIIGLGKGEMLFASDVPAIMKYTKEYIIMEDDEVAVLTKTSTVVYKELQPISKPVQTVNWSMDAAQKGGYKHFMVKEIYEQPKALRSTLKGRISEDGKRVIFDAFNFDAKRFLEANKITIVACGTSYHAGLIGKDIMESLLRVPVEVEIASEFRYRDPIIDEKSVVIVISQSGETADTLAALRESKQRGAAVIAISNVVGSAIAREADAVIYTYAGPEIAVASTKAYITQLMALYLLTLYVAGETGKLSDEAIGRYLQSCTKLPEQVEAILKDCAELLNQQSQYLVGWEDCFFIGRGMDYAVSLEGALKLKEISYIHAEAYAAGELKHGTIALIDEGVPVIALCTQQKLLDKVVSNIVQVKARGAKVFGIAFEDDRAALSDVLEMGIYLPQTENMFAPVLTVVPMQLLAYLVATGRGCNPDQPKNLAKSVTVE